jgi:hypothetical protein
MNKENLLWAAKFIRDVPQEKFDMGVYREDDNDTDHICNSVGCVIGHCVALSGNRNVHRHISGDIDFLQWSESFFDIKYLDNAWDWCFDARWKHTDNMPEGAALRMEWLVEHGLPKDWQDQMIGNTKPCYR